MKKCQPLIIETSINPNEFSLTFEREMYQDTGVGGSSLCQCDLRKFLSSVALLSRNRFGSF